MKGTVRAWCPKCRKQQNCGDSEKSKIAPYCIQCENPLKYYVHIYHKGAIKIYHSQLGLPLDSYLLAYQALHAVRYEITNNRFDRTRYVKKDQRQFQFHEAWRVYYESEASRFDLEQGSLEGKKGAAKHLLSWFGTQDLRDIMGVDVIKLKTSLLRGYAPKTTRSILGVLGHFLRWAYISGLREAPPPMPKVKLIRRVPIWLNEENQEKILAEFLDADRGFFEFCMLHGTRPGEARALQWKDIEWNVKVMIEDEEVSIDTITIRRAWGRKEMKSTKTGDERILILHPRSKAWILDHRRLNPLDLVFCNEDGQPYVRNWPHRKWMEACRKAGIEGVRLYEGTRHSFASQHVMAGGSLKDIQAVLGHRSIQMTLRYAHEDLRASMRTIGKGSIHRLSTAKKDGKRNEE